MAKKLQCLSTKSSLKGLVFCKALPDYAWPKSFVGLLKRSDKTIFWWNWSNLPTISFIQRNNLNNFWLKATILTDITLLNWDSQLCIFRWAILRVKTFFFQAFRRPAEARAQQLRRDEVEELSSAVVVVEERRRRLCRRPVQCRQRSVVRRREHVCGTVKPKVSKLQLFPGTLGNWRPQWKLYRYLG